MTSNNHQNQIHSNAWLVQVWVSFVLSTSMTMIGIFYLPINNWVKGYLGMGLAFSIGSTIALSKTTRDLHESNKIVSRIDEARVEQLLAEHHPLKIEK